MIVYQGPSAIDGRPIVVILTGLKARRGSKNAKTGTLVQSWILRADVEPHTAVKTGDDASVCVVIPSKSGQGFRVRVADSSTLTGTWQGG